MSERPELSWLKLEQRLLNELEPAEASAVDAAVAGAPRLAARVAAIADAPALPPLDLSREDSGLPLPDEARPTGGAEVIPLRRWAGVATALALAAAALLVVWVGPKSEHPGPQTRWKGGELALTLDRARDGRVLEDAADFRPGDRFRVRLTCPPGDRAWDLVVYQEGEASFPLDATEPLACGNRVVLPGAFTLDGDDEALVCAVLEPPSRAGLAGGPPREGSVCAVLRPGG